MFKVSEIFYSLQGEGRWVGLPCVFVRFSGCDLDCEFCDEGGAFGSNPTPFELTASQIAEQCRKASGQLFPNIVLTGGEPTMQLQDDEAVELACALQGCHIAIESNGHFPVPSWVDWFTLSPKDTSTRDFTRVPDEIKFLMDADGSFYNGTGAIIPACKHLKRTARYIQPLTYADKARTAASVKHAMDYVMNNDGFLLGCRIQEELHIK